MDEISSELLSAVREIRDLIRLMAEPALAERDKKLRNELRRIVGKSAPKANAVLLMDGSRTQRAIHKETKIHEGQLSTLVKQLNAANLLTDDGNGPKLVIAVPANFFENGASNE
jgi:hypothetical protein